MVLASAYTENWYVWIDLNQDNGFSDEERLFTIASNSDAAADLVIPETVLTGVVSTHALTLDATYKVTRSGFLGEGLT